MNLHYQKKDLFEFQLKGSSLRVFNALAMQKCSLVEKNHYLLKLKHMPLANQTP